MALFISDCLTVDGDIVYKLASHYELSLACRNLTSVTEAETEGEREVRTGNGDGRALTLALRANY